MNQNDKVIPLPNENKKNTFVWGVKQGENIVARIETIQEQEKNRIRIIEFWIDSAFDTQMMGHRFIDIVKDQARLERRKSILVEVLSNNTSLVDLYLREGFQLVTSATNYKHNYGHMEEEKVLLEWRLIRKQRVTKKEILIREERESEYYDTEWMTLRAFWNLHNPGCNEHYLVHKLRLSKDYKPELSRVAVNGDKVIGCIMYSLAKVVDEDQSHDVLTFGPLCIDPEWQGCGVGELLLEETMGIARVRGYKGIIIYGEPEYYPRFGFHTCDHYDITTPDRTNFDAFMGIELIKDGLKDVKGKFYESNVFEQLHDHEVEEYTKKFPYIAKQKFPSQWD